MLTVKKLHSRKRIARREKVSLVEEGQHQLDPRVTVNALPRGVLVEIFDFYLVGSNREDTLVPFKDEDTWQTLVHVCKKWRYIVFASPQRLRLQLLCTNERPVQNTLNLWPELPIVVRSRGGMSEPQDANNIIAALKLHDRVCEIDVDDIPNTFLEKIPAMKMMDPFPVLTFLWLSSGNDDAPALPDDFLGGSAPRLQTLELVRIPFPGLPKLLLSTTDLVKLCLLDISEPGYISPLAMVTGLSVLARLQTLCLTFRSLRSRVDRESRLLPSLTRFVLPALTKFKFRGDSEYLEDILAQIDTPRLGRLEITSFNQLIFDAPLLHHFISCTETLKQPHQAKMTFRSYGVSFDLAWQDGNGKLGPSIFSSSLRCRPSDLQLSSLARICNLALFPLPIFERLEIGMFREDWEDDPENTQWLEVLNPFSSVKDLVLHGNLIRLIALALKYLTRERVADVLPALKNLFLWGPQPSKSVNKAIRRFIAARHFSGRPVIVHYRETMYQDYSDQLYPQVTVSPLPDDVLLEIFDFYLVRSVGEHRHDDAWHTLVHVCKKWRCIVFASPHRLQLQLLCTSKTPVQDTLDVWPELPIVLEVLPGMSTSQDANNILAVLRQPSRVCKITINGIPNTYLKKIQAMKMTDPFLALTSLSLWSLNDKAIALPDSFLGGSAPRLQTLFLRRIPFPGLPKLLLSTCDLVELELWDIPLSGYISPLAMVTGLSALSRLQNLDLRFRSPRFRADRENRLPPRPTRLVLPALTKFEFKGDSEYLEDILAQIDTPQLDGLKISFFNQIVFDTPSLCHFISRTEIAKLPLQAKVTFSWHSVSLDLSQQGGDSNWRPSTLSLSILCRPSDWQLSSLAQICNSVLFPLPISERLEISSLREDRDHDIENIQWFEVLNPFTSVKDLVLRGKFIQLFALALGDLTGEHVAEVLPALQNLFLWDPDPSESVKKAISQFIVACRLSGRPITVHHKKAWDQDYSRWEVGN